MKKFMLLVASLAFLSSPAFAAKTAVARHCVGKDGKEISVTSTPGKSLSAVCKASGGKWVRMKAAKTK